MDLQTGHLEDRYHVQIVLLLLFSVTFFCVFSESNFPKLFIFLAFGHKKIRKHLVKGVHL